jgi:hypothetical protein
MVDLSPLAGAGWQFFGNNGLPLAGGKLFSYAAGTTTPLATFTSISGATPHANPIILDSAGRVPSQVWLTAASAYKFTLKTSADVEIWTKDNISGIETGFTAPSGSSLVGFIQAGVSAVARTAQAKMREIFSVTDFGAVCDGTTDDTAAIQACYTALSAAGGGTVSFPAGKTAIVSQSILVSSNTTTMFNGATIKAKNPGWIGTNAGLTCFIFRNLNYSAAVLTDSNIAFIGPGFIDYNGVTVVGGGAHMIAMRYVENVTVDNISGEDGENVTALLACKDTFTINCKGHNQLNCYFDHWDGAGVAKVIGCNGRNDVGKPIAQGIQFTGTASNLDNRTSLDCYVSGCYLEGVRDTGSSSAIIANSNDVGSSVFRFISMGNTVRDSDLGLVFEGVGGQHLSVGDTFVSVDGLPVFIKAFSGGGNAPSNSRVIAPHLVDCDHAPGNIAMVSISGDSNSVTDIKVSNSGAAAYGSIVYFTSTATNCIATIESGATGSAARVIDTGTSNLTVDGLSNVAALATSWTVYTPTVTAQTGTFTTATASGRFKQIGKIVHFSAQIVITTNGTAADSVRATLPSTAQAANATFGAGRESSTGTLLLWFNQSTTIAQIVTTTGTYPGGNGRTLDISGTYEAA